MFLASPRSSGKVTQDRPPAATTHVEINVDPRTPSRRTFLGLAMGVPWLAALAACGSSGPSSSTASGSAGAAGSRRLLLVPHRPARRGHPQGRRRPLQRRQPEHPDRPDGVPERRLQDEDQDRHRRRPGPDDHLGLGRWRPQVVRRRQPGRGPHVVVRRERRRQGQALPVLVRGGDGRRQDLRHAVRDGPADRALLQQDGLRQGRRAAAHLVGRHHGAGPEVQRRRASPRSPSVASPGGPT